MKREKEATRSWNARWNGVSRSISMLPAKPWAKTTSGGPSPYVA